MYIKITLSAVLLVLVGACSNEQTMAKGCQELNDCQAGFVCNTTLNQCLPLATTAPSLEVVPPAENSQGFVPQEFSQHRPEPDGWLNINLDPGISMQGFVYASGSEGNDEHRELIPARIIAWRESLIPGRPDVQFETQTQPGKRDGQMDSYVLWLNRGHTYTVNVIPQEGYDSIYPPLLETGLKLDEHLNKDFVLEGESGSVKVIGRVVDSNKSPLPFPVRIRAHKEGVRQSTIGSTEPDTGEFAFRVPKSTDLYTNYTIRVETMPDSTPIPSVTCPNRVLGLLPTQQAYQDIGNLMLPAFRFPVDFTVRIVGKAEDGSLEPVGSASVTFATSLPSVNDGPAACTASFSQTKITNGDDGKVFLPLIPGTSTRNQVYTVTVLPKSGKYASRWIGSFEVGPFNGVLADIVLDLRHRMSGTVVDPDGAPVEGATVEAQGIESSDNTMTIPALNASSVTDEQGKFELFVDPGVYNFEVTPPQGLGLPRFGIPGRKIEGDSEGEIFRIPKAKVVMGRVLDHHGNELPDMRIQIYDLVSEVDNPVDLKAVLRGNTITDNMGTFNFFMPETEN